MSEKATVLVSEAKEVKSGTNAKGTWHLYGVIDANETFYSTFDHSLFKTAEGLAGKRAEIEYEQAGDRKNLKAITEAAAADNGDQPKLGTGDYITGQKPEIEARRIAAAVAVNNAHKYAELEFRMLNVQREWSPADVETVVDKWLNKLWIWKLRKDETMRDSDIPFMPEHDPS